MNSTNYARFLPTRYADHATSIPMTSTWWHWRGRQVHVARAHNPAAQVRLLGVHGAGGHSGALWPFAALAAGEAVDVVFPDLPLYGRTIDPDPGAVRYETWVHLLCDLVVAERRADDRPLVLLGASMGGMLAYEVAARTGKAAAVVATCLLDPADPEARAAAACFPAMGWISPGALRRASRLAGHTRVPIRWLADLRHMSLDPDLSRLCATDPRGGGVRVPLGWLASFLAYRHTTPESFDKAPITLVHPASDQWTPPELSIRFLQRVNASTSLVMLEGCGHFPIEEPGVTQLADTMRALRDDLAGPR